MNAALLKERSARRERTLARYADAGLGNTATESRARLCHAVVVDHLDLAETIARRYSRGTQDWSDIRQVAYLGLVKAAQRFDADKGDDFVSFAVPTISGEIKRHLRDNGWFVRPPRHVQELHASITRALPALAQKLGRIPSSREIADELSQPHDRVREALASQESLRPASLDHPAADGNSTVGDLVAFDDLQFESADVSVEVLAACRALSLRDRRILWLRFFENHTQQEIATELGVTQMQVSRLIRRILGELRERLSPPLAATA
ncbi:sigma-70 family RNA polymerase sigma factor [Salinibacterium sp. SYSU T00001]|uniref:sigma-70 family RNA polymerase sigma factor n=1 Tax=Homoserinimonas sedimenticola TaxID=2986805 RepID=UPI0022359589|nr:sigma-70 family RNA polymerase sigma factor [Salinibacterium sedimenticola]MCW4385588.1 sigma-70 family RNA polymerase sigma factor [Salinibacterium sedimenticola]